MSHDPDYTRRWLLNAGGAAILSGTLAGAAQPARAASGPAPEGDGDSPAQPAAISPITTALADFVAGTLDRPLPAAALSDTKLHLIDTIAAIVSGARLKPGLFAARYVESLGGKPQATVIGTRILTSTVNAALANGMSGHADETDDSIQDLGFHAGCGVVPAVLAVAEATGRSGTEVLRAVAVGYDIGARLLRSVAGGGPHPGNCMGNTFAATAAVAALLRLEPRQVRHAFSFAGQQASGMSYWNRDLEHIEKAFDFGGMGARNGTMAATMVAMGATGVDDPFSGSPNLFTTLGDKPTPELLVADLGTKFEVTNSAIKKWSVGSGLQSVLDSMAELLKDPAVRAGRIKRITVDVPTNNLRIFNNNPNPNLCMQHLVALMVADGGAGFHSVHDASRMRDPKVLAIRRLVELVDSPALQAAQPRHQTIVRIETADGRSLMQHTKVVRGTVLNPMNAGEVEAKALDLIAPVLGAARARSLIAALGTLDQSRSVSGLRQLLQA
jgi:2-methylcitrate dehydratase PrpD